MSLLKSILEMSSEKAAEKNLGRRKAGSWNRLGSKEQKRVASKAVRRSGKDKIADEMKEGLDPRIDEGKWNYSKEMKNKGPGRKSGGDGGALTRGQRKAFRKAEKKKRHQALMRGELKEMESPNEHLQRNVTDRIMRQIESNYPEIINEYGRKEVREEADENSYNLTHNWPEDEGFGSSDSYGAYANTLAAFGVYLTKRLEDQAKQSKKWQAAEKARATRNEGVVTEVSLGKKIAALRSMTQAHDDDDWYGDSLAANKALTKRRMKMRNKIKSKHGDKAVQDAERGIEIDKEGRKDHTGGIDRLDKRAPKIMKGGPRKGKMSAEDIRRFKIVGKHRAEMRQREKTNEEAAAGSIGAHSIAVGADALGSEPSEKLPKAGNIFDKKKKKKRKMRKRDEGAHMFNGSLLKELVTEDSSTFDPADVISKLKASEKSAEADQDVVKFGLEDEEGNIVKVSVRSDQAEDFQHALEEELARVNDGEDEDVAIVSTTEIAEVLFELKDKFDIVDVEWGTIPEDEEVDQDVEGENLDSDAGMEGGEEDLGDEEGMDDEMVADDEMDGEGAAASALTQVINMMQSDSAAKQAEAEAEKAKWEAESAKYASQAASEKVRQEEEILDMETYNKAQADSDKEAKTLAQLAKYKHDMKGDAVADEMADTGMDDMNDVDLDVDAEVDIDVEDEERSVGQELDIDDLMTLLRRSAAN